MWHNLLWQGLLKINDERHHKWESIESCQFIGLSLFEALLLQQYPVEPHQNHLCHVSWAHPFYFQSTSLGWFAGESEVWCDYHPDHPVTKESMLTSETYVCAGDKTNAIKREKKHQIFGCKIIILCNISMQNDTFSPLHQSGIGTISTMCRSPKIVSQSTCASCWMSKGHT